MFSAPQPWRARLSGPAGTARSRHGTRGPRLACASVPRTQAAGAATASGPRTAAHACLAPPGPLVPAACGRSLAAPNMATTGARFQGSRGFQERASRVVRSRKSMGAGPSGPQWLPLRGHARCLALSRNTHASSQMSNRATLSTLSFCTRNRGSLEKTNEAPLRHQRRSHGENCVYQRVFAEGRLPIVHQQEGNGCVRRHAFVPIDEWMVTAEVEQYAAAMAGMEACRNSTEKVA